jgi:hypothetical protein
LCGGGGAVEQQSMNEMQAAQQFLQHNNSSSMSCGVGGRAPFTSGQWAELEHQALIFKYMMAGVNVPPELLNPIRKSMAALINGMTASHHAANRELLLSNFLLLSLIAAHSPRVHNAAAAGSSTAAS